MVAEGRDKTVKTGNREKPYSSESAGATNREKKP
jgi:hypothetical protein